jgi:hypothetical protein
MDKDFSLTLEPKNLSAVIGFIPLNILSIPAGVIRHIICIFTYFVGKFMYRSFKGYIYILKLTYKYCYFKSSRERKNSIRYHL